MDTKEMSSGILKALRSLPGKIFFLVVILSFSVFQEGTSPSRVPFKTELHEKAASRVSRPGIAYAPTFSKHETIVKRNFLPALTVIQISNSHRLKIFRTKKSEFHNRNGIHLRLSEENDSAHSLT